LPPDNLTETESPDDTDDEMFTIAKIKILLLVDDGVIVAVNPVMSVNVVLVVVNVLVFAVLTTCKTRNAPRKAFCCAAVKT
jgi:hypothetical protein